MKYLVLISTISIIFLHSCSKQPPKEPIKTIQIIKHNENYFEVRCGDTFFEYSKENCGADCMELLNDIYECKE